MSERTELSPDERTLVDTNFFVAIGCPENEKFQRFRETVTDRNVVLSVPKRVWEDLSIHLTERRLSTALGEGWPEIVSAPPLTASEAVAATDHARRTIADLIGRDEHDIEKADTIFVELAVQYLALGDERVTILTDDGPAKTGIKTAVETVDIHGTVRVLTLEDVLGDSDDDITII